MAVQPADSRFSMFLRCEILDADALARYSGVIILEAAEAPMR
jgi:hypothetical protein